MPALEKDLFFERMSEQGLALTFADVSLETAASEVGEHEVDLTSKFTRNVDLKLPFVSAAMDTVTDHRMAIAMAKLGGIGVIHMAFEPDEQKEEVQKVKYEYSPVVDKPFTYGPDETLDSINARCEEKRRPFRSFPIVDRDGKAVGLITQHHFDLARHRSEIVTAGDVMIPLDQLTYGSPDTTTEEAYTLMQQSGIKTIPLLNEDRTIAGLYAWKDVDRKLSGEAASYNTDAKGRLRVAVAVPTGPDGLKRIEMIGNNADVFVIDSSTGDKKYAREMLRDAKQVTDVDIMPGNISNAMSIANLLDLGADGIKVGQGPGSICTTQEVLGYGKPQLTAIYECARAARGSGAPICADGGVSRYGHISKAIAAGADSVMMGRMLAGTQESAAPEIMVDGIIKKLIRGMGSRDAMKENPALQKRYYEIGKKDPLAQGVPMSIPVEGDLEKKVGEIEQAIRGSMSGCNSATIEAHQQSENARFVRRTQNAVIEERPHDGDVITQPIQLRRTTDEQ